MRSFFRRKGVKRIVVGFAVIAVIILGIRMLNPEGNRSLVDDQYRFVSAELRDLTVELSGTGTLKAADAYTLTTLISGDVLGAPFEEGDIVDKDEILFEIDSSNIASSIESAEISLSESKRNYQRKLENLKNLKVTSSTSGTLTQLFVKVGDEVQVGQLLATIRDNSSMLLELPFSVSDARTIVIGQIAIVTVEGSYETLQGKVTKVSKVDEVNQNGMIVNKVTIEVNNPGALQPNHIATAKILDFSSFATGNFTYKDEASIYAKITGDVKSLFVEEGDYVLKGVELFHLESASLQDDLLLSKNNLRRSEISLENQYETLKQYTINSPIRGTVIEKNFKEGDTIEGGKPLATIFDLDYLTLSLLIDELDISKITVGQMVTIKGEAVTNKTFEGLVTKVNINGITSGGTTSYPITIRIDQTDGLLPGMNVDAQIVVESKKAVLTIPNEAVFRGSRVLIRASEDEIVENAPKGFKYVDIITGLSDQDYIEVLEGLKLGDEIAIAIRVARDSFEFGRPEGNRP